MKHGDLRTEPNPTQQAPTLSNEVRNYNGFAVAGAKGVDRAIRERHKQAD
jgi:hypothetical protein